MIYVLQIMQIKSMKKLIYVFTYSFLFYKVNKIVLFIKIKISIIGDFGLRD